MKKTLIGMSLAELQEFITDMGGEKYRAGQVFKWIYRGVESFDEMTDISIPFREKLKEKAEIPALFNAERLISKADGTRKYLFELKDGNKIESVYMKYRFGNSICVSSQAGCRMGCIFCASGAMGLTRDLSAGEMAGQIIKAQNDTNEIINHIVVMGIGEPFDNYENLADFIRLINDSRGLSIGMRNITVSTCGIIPKIRSFSHDFPQVNLAVSLHATNDEERKALMPIACQYKYGELMAACRRHAETTGRRITFEYMLISGKNDDDRHADELAANIKGILCHVNLIPVNEIPGLAFGPSARNKAEQFQNRLSKSGVTATIRRELGSDIKAACGQLRLSYRKDKDV
jgi:23S rRNA (adenine2503-C2)-methyltransferase